MGIQDSDKNPTCVVCGKNESKRTAYYVTTLDNQTICSTCIGKFGCSIPAAKSLNLTDIVKKDEVTSQETPDESDGTIKNVNIKVRSITLCDACGLVIPLGRHLYTADNREICARCEYKMRNIHIDRGSIEIMNFSDVDEILKSTFPTISRKDELKKTERGDTEHDLMCSVCGNKYGDKRLVTKDKHNLCALCATHLRCSSDELSNLTISEVRQVIGESDKGYAKRISLFGDSRANSELNVSNDEQSSAPQIEENYQSRSNNCSICGGEGELISTMRKQSVCYTCANKTQLPFSVIMKMEMSDIKAHIDGLSKVVVKTVDEETDSNTYDNHSHDFEENVPDSWIEVTKYEMDVLDCVHPFVGKSVEQIAEELNLTIHLWDKGIYARVSRMMLGSKGKKVEILEKMDVDLRTIRISESGNPEEDTPFSVFDFEDIINNPWEESELCRRLKKRFLLVVFQSGKDGLNLKTVKFWSMSQNDLDVAKKEWTIAKNRMMSGELDTILRKSETQIIHVRPYAKNRLDQCIGPDGKMYVKRGFWLNSKYVGKIIDTDVIKNVKSTEIMQVDGVTKKIKPEVEKVSIRNTTIDSSDSSVKYDAIIDDDSAKGQSFEKSIFYAEDTSIDFKNPTGLEIEVSEHFSVGDQDIQSIQYDDQWGEVRAYLYQMNKLCLEDDDLLLNALPRLMETICNISDDPRSDWYINALCDMAVSAFIVNSTLDKSVLKCITSVVIKVLKTIQNSCSYRVVLENLAVEMDAKEYALLIEQYGSSNEEKKEKMLEAIGFNGLIETIGSKYDYHGQEEERLLLDRDKIALYVKMKHALENNPQRMNAYLEKYEGAAMSLFAERLVFEAIGGRTPNMFCPLMCFSKSKAMADPIIVKGTLFNTILCTLISSRHNNAIDTGLDHLQPYMSVLYKDGGSWMEKAIINSALAYMVKQNRLSVSGKPPSDDMDCKLVLISGLNVAMHNNPPVEWDFVKVYYIMNNLDDAEEKCMEELSRIGIESVYDVMARSNLIQTKKVVDWLSMADQPYVEFLKGEHRNILEMVRDVDKTMGMNPGYKNRLCIFQSLSGSESEEVADIERTIDTLSSPIRRKNRSNRKIDLDMEASSWRV